MLKVLIAGGSGFLGDSLKHELSKDYHVVSVSRSSGVDICYYRHLDKIANNYDVVVNCAATIQVDSENVDEAIAVNVQGAYNLAKFSQKVGAYYVHVSSISAIMHKQNDYYGWYGLTKEFGEQVVTKYMTESSLSGCIIRFSQLYGNPSTKAQLSQPMLFRIIRQLQENGIVTFYGTKNPKRNFLYIDDACIMIKHLIQTRVQGVWNGVNTESLTLQQVVACIADRLNIDGRVEYLDDKPDIPSIYIPTDNLLHSIMNGYNQVTFQQGMRYLLESQAV